MFSLRDARLRKTIKVLSLVDIDLEESKSKNKYRIPGINFRKLPEIRIIQDCPSAVNVIFTKYSSNISMHEFCLSLINRLIVSGILSVSHDFSLVRLNYFK